MIQIDKETNTNKEDSSNESIEEDSSNESIFYLTKAIYHPLKMIKSFPVKISNLMKKALMKKHNHWINV